MNKLLSFVFIFIALFAMNCSTPEVESSATFASDKQLAVKVDGMVCEVGCAKYIEKKVAEMKGVSDCKVNFEEGMASISFSSEATDQDQIVEAIRDLNDGQYNVTVVDLSGKSGKSSSGPMDNEGEDSETEVRIHFPELMTYFLSRIISRA